MVFVIVKLLANLSVLKEWFQTPEDKYPVCDIYVCPVVWQKKKNLCPKEGRMAGKEKTKRNN